ncbi:MAG: adenylate/guanylate cyclase domain-containing protein [Candidatus Limnocylindrales bacterium]
MGDQIEIEDRSIASPPEDHGDDAVRTEEWRSILTGTDPGLIRLRKLWNRVPSSPRCKFCASPFKGPGRVLTKLIMHGQSNQNPLFCNACFSDLARHPGGAEVEISVLFADVRGSTGLAEQTTAAQFRGLIQEFYRATSGAIDRNGGLVDKFMGDGVMALFIPIIAGETHAARAIQAGEDVLAAARSRHLTEGGIRVGVGVHSGPAFVGTVGSGDRLDFSALGDTVNIAARLGSVAGPGELVVGRSAWDRAERGFEGVEARQIPISGRTTGLDVVVSRERSAAARPA